MSSTQFWVGILVPPLIKWANPFLRKYFKLNEFDSEIKSRVLTKKYPAYYVFLYSLWILALLASGITVLLLMMVYGQAIFPGKSYAVPVFLGLINMIGVWFVLGGLLDFLFWQMSSGNFRDYVMMRQLKSGWGYDIKGQIKTLLKIGFFYYLLAIPIMAILLFIS